MSFNSVYIKLNRYLIALSILGLTYFFFFETIELSLVYAAFCIVFYFLSYIALHKINSVFIKINFIFFYFGYLLSMPIIFINKDKYQEIGWSGIGVYKFQADQTLEALGVVSIYIVTFIFIAYLLDKLLLRKYTLESTNIKSKVFDNMDKFKKFKNIFIIILIFQLYLSYVMFQYQIGIVGIQPEEGLRFRITGILYYYRYLIIPIVSFILLFSNLSKRNSFIIFIILLETTVSGLFSVSRALTILHVLPLISYLIIKKNKVFLTFVIIYILILLSAVTIGRNLIFHIDDFKNINLLDIIEFTLESKSIDLESIFKMAGTIIVRFQGFHEFFATYFGNLTYVDHNLFLHVTLGITSLDYGNFSAARDVFGVIMPDGKAFGMPIDNLSNLYLSTTGIVDTFFIIFLWVFLLILSEKMLNIIFRDYRRNFFFLLLLNMFALFGIVQPSVKSNFFIIPVILTIVVILKIIVQSPKSKKELNV